MHLLSLTQYELEFLARLVGHHVTGSGADELYEKICQKLPPYFINNMAPLEASKNEALYGSRPMIRAPAK